jgi:hypothetical protein
MSSVNSYLQANYAENKELKSLDPNATATTGQIGNAFVFGGTAGYYVIPELSAGGRLELINFFSVEESAKSTLYGINISDKYSGSITPVMAGVTYDYPIKGTNFLLSGDAYIGYGFASFNQVMDLNGTSYSLYSNGGGFVAEFCANLDYNFTRDVFCGIKLGYRGANIGSMVYSDSTEVEELQGSTVKDSKGNTIDFDYSGIIFDISAGYKF